MSHVNYAQSLANSAKHAHQFAHTIQIGRPGRAMRADPVVVRRTLEPRRQTAAPIRTPNPPPISKHQLVTSNDWIAWITISGF